MPDRLTDAQREAMKAAMGAGVPAEMRREMGEDVRDEQPLTLDGAERYGFEVGWRTLAALPREAEGLREADQPTGDGPSVPVVPKFKWDQALAERDESFGVIEAICKRLHDPDCENGCDEGLEYEGDEWCPCDCTFRDVPMQENAQDRIIERVRAALRPLGYAVAVHGSRIRDLDLIAVPWVEDAEPDPKIIADALREASFDELGMGGKASPHNRLGFALHGVPASAGVRYIDLSVILAASPVASRECARCHRPDYMHTTEIPERGVFECWIDGALVCVGWVPPSREVEGKAREFVVCANCPNPPFASESIACRVCRVGTDAWSEGDAESLLEKASKDG